MKNESAYSKKMAALIKKVRDAHKPAPLPTYDPLMHLVVGFLQWNASRKMAEAAYSKLMAPMVDSNDLRVSHQIELISLIGSDYPRVEERTARLHEVLQEIYNREHGMSLTSVASAGKKQARTYLESLPGMLSYVTSRVLLLAMGGHAMPVDDLLREKLVSQEVVEPNASNEEIAAFLERVVKAGEGEAVHLALEDWAAVGGVKKTLAAAEKKSAAASPKPVASTAKGSASKPATPKPSPAPRETRAKGGSVKTTQAKAAKAKPAAVVTAEVKSKPKTNKKTTKKTTRKTTGRGTGKGN